MLWKVESTYIHGIRHEWRQSLWIASSLKLFNHRILFEPLFYYFLCCCFFLMHHQSSSSRSSSTTSRQTNEWMNESIINHNKRTNNSVVSQITVSIKPTSSFNPSIDHLSAFISSTVSIIHTKHWPSQFDPFQSFTLSLPAFCFQLTFPYSLHYMLSYLQHHHCRQQDERRP